jgi:HSP20 family protein
MFPSLSRRGGFSDPFTSLQRELNRAFDRAWPEEQQDLVGAYPVDIRETDEQLVVEAEMPGFDKKDIEVTLENGVLSIQAQRQDESEGDGQRHLNERRFTRVARSFTLPQHVDEQDVEAQLDNGVLTLKLNKKEEARSRKIEVK